MVKFFIALASIVFLSTGCNQPLKVITSETKEQSNMNYKLDGQIIIANQTLNFELADEPGEYSQGLSFREGISDEWGMLFDFKALVNGSFWMKDMNFAIDIIWILEDQVVGIEKNAKPEPGKTSSELTRYLSPTKINKVLELNSGWSDKYGLKVGDRIKIEYRQD